MNKNFYEILGVTAQATSEQIKNAAVKLVRQYHPKDHPDNPQANAQFNQIKVAYATLIDPQRRAAYDLSLSKTTPTLAFKEEPIESDSKMDEVIEEPHAPWLIYFFSLLFIGVPIYLLFINPTTNFLTQVEFLQGKSPYVNSTLQLLIGFGSLMLLYALFLQFRDHLHWFIYLLALLLIAIAAYLLFLNPELLDHYNNQIKWLHDKPIRLVLQILLGFGIILFIYALFLHHSLQENGLFTGEVVIYRASIHWVIYLTPLLFIVGSVYCLFIDPLFLNNYLSYIGFLRDRSDQVQLGLKIVLGVAMGSFLYALYRQLATTLMITSKRTLCQSGFFFKKTLEIEHNSIENVGLDQSLLGKILFYGTIDVRGMNSRGLSNRRIKIRNVAFPKKFKNTLLRSLKRHFL